MVNKIDRPNTTPTVRGISALVKIAHFRLLKLPKGWFSLTHKHKHKSTYADAVRC